MRPEVLATVTHGLIRWSCHYCHTLIEGPGVAGLRLQDITDFWHPDTAEDPPRAQWYLCHTAHEALLLEDRHYASGRHATARAVQEAVAQDENGPDVHRINLNELATVADVAFHTHHTVRPHGWLEDTDWLTAIAAPAGLTHPHPTDHPQSVASRETPLPSRIA